MSISKYPSTVTLPPAHKPYPSIIDFLVKRFPNIEKEIWSNRIAEGKIIDESGKKISFSTKYVPGDRLQYYREILNEPKIPFQERIIFENEEYIIADKPHFLPVIPAGPYVNECLLNRLRARTGNDNLTPVNRIDRETAGLVMFSCNQKTRGLYSHLFSEKKVHKIYEAITDYTSPHVISDRIIENRITKGEPWFRMKIETGATNAITQISLLKSKNNLALFELIPVTGKKHQLRLHLSSMGFRIINDRYYPDLLEKKETDYKKPLQLLAKKIEFVDPVTGELKFFSSTQTLSKNWE